MAFKGVLLSGIPNAALISGYTNASWTLKCDLTCHYACRLINHMDEHGYDYCVAERDPDMEAVPFMDLRSGYIQRAMDQFPKQGELAPWRLRQNYFFDILNLRMKPLDDDALRFDRRSGGERAADDGDELVLELAE
jgi:hypothetical protein